MVAYKSSAVASFVKAPKQDCRAVLVYGPDAGLVAERADALAQFFARKGQGTAEIVRLDDRDFSEDPARLEVELKTVPLFAARSVVRVAAGRAGIVIARRQRMTAMNDRPLIVKHHPGPNRW